MLAGGCVPSCGGRFSVGTRRSARTRPSCHAQENRRWILCPAPSRRHGSMATKLLSQYETELGVRFVNVEPLLYLIHHPNNRPFSSFVGGQTRTLLSAEVLWVALEAHLKQISFVDIYEDPSLMSEALGCKPRLILEENEQGFFLNHRLILGRRSPLRCFLLRRLGLNPENSFVSYADLAKQAEASGYPPSTM